MAVGQPRALRVGPLGVSPLAITLHAETGSERASAIHDVKARVVEIGRARMPEFRLAPAGPGKAVIVAADLRIVLRRSEEHTSELQSLMRISYAVFCLKKKKKKDKIK